MILQFLSDDMESLHPQVCSVLHASFQSHIQHAFDAADLRRFPSYGDAAYISEEIAWCEKTTDFLESQLDKDGRAKRGLPTRQKRPWSRTAAAAQEPAKTPKNRSPGAGAAEIETENDSDTHLLSRRPRPRSTPKAS